MASYEETAQDSYDEARAERVQRTVPRRGRAPGDTLGERQKRLWEAAEVLDNALDTLTGRISPVLLPEREGALAGIDGDTADVSELSGFLDQLNDKLARLGRRVSELSERVDL